MKFDSKLHCFKKLHGKVIVFENEQTKMTRTREFHI